MTKNTITMETLLAAYTNGYFPMAASKDDASLHWLSPEMRGVIPLDAFHVPRSLVKAIKKAPFAITTDQAFPEVIKACADAREDTWINEQIINLYCELYENSFAHSVECWQNEKLVGGLYGVAIGGAFFGESMFSRATNASKIALVHLVDLLNNAGYTLLDAQFTNDHLKQFGIIEMPKADYLEKLAEALAITPKDCFLSSPI